MALTLSIRGAQLILAGLAVVAPLAALCAAWPRALGVAGRLVVSVAPSLAKRRSVGAVARLVRWLDGASDNAFATRAPRGPASRRRGRKDIGVVAGISSLVAVAQAVWIWQHRSLGNLDWDETRYVAAAFRSERLLSGGYVADAWHFYGPAVPFLSGVSMLVGPVDVRMAISAQLILTVGIAVSATGVCRRVASSHAAVFAGVATSLLPATMAASQEYLLVLGAAFGLTAGVWALLASEHGHGWQIWIVGPLFVLAPMSRGMTMGLLPAAFVATLLYCSASSRGLRRAVVSLSLGTVAVSGYFLTHGAAIVGYVVSGLTADASQAPSLFDRLSYRWSEVSDGFGRPLLLVGVLMGAVGLANTIRHGRYRRSIRGSEFAALVVVVIGGGTVFLLGGYIGGLGFWDYPLIPLLVVMLVALAARSGSRLSAVAGVGSLGWLCYLALVTLWVVPPTAPMASAGLGRYSTPIFEKYKGAFDPRFTPARRSEQREASAEWAEASARIDRSLHEYDAATDKQLEVFYWGGSNYVIYSSEIFAAWDEGDPVRYADGPGPMIEGDWSRVLDARDEATVRVLLVTQINEPVDDDGRTALEYEVTIGDANYQGGVALRSVAEDRGWRIVDRVALPLGDDMLIYAPPE